MRSARTLLLVCLSASLLTTVCFGSSNEDEVAFEADELHGIGAAVDEPRSFLPQLVAVGPQKGIPAQAAALPLADGPLLEWRNLRLGNDQHRGGEFVAAL